MQNFTLFCYVLVHCTERYGWMGVQLRITRQVEIRSLVFFEKREENKLIFLFQDISRIESIGIFFLFLPF